MNGVNEMTQTTVQEAQATRLLERLEGFSAEEACGRFWSYCRQSAAGRSPQRRAFLALLRRYPNNLALLCGRGRRFLGRAIRQRRAANQRASNQATALVLLSLLLPPVAALLVALAFLFPETAGKIATAVPRLKRRAVRAIAAQASLFYRFLLAYVVGFVRTSLHQTGVRVPRDGLAAASGPWHEWCGEGGV